jgi:hypothetical protein
LDQSHTKSQTSRDVRLTKDLISCNGEHALISSASYKR